MKSGSQSFLSTVIMVSTGTTIYKSKLKLYTRKITQLDTGKAGAIGSENLAELSTPKGKGLREQRERGNNTQLSQKWWHMPTVPDTLG